MSGYRNHRLLTVSLALAASGVLTCGLALADIVLPRGSAIVVLVSIPLLAAVALGVLIAFAWTCELVDRRGGLRIPRWTACKSRKPWQLVSARGPSISITGARRPASKTALPLRPMIDYPVNLRGRMRFQGNRWIPGRHGH